MSNQVKGRSAEVIQAIERVDFSIWSNKEIKANSVMKDRNNPNGIIINQIYNNGEPVVGGPADKRMGSVDKGKCKTCGEIPAKCPGHFGHISLAEVCHHPLFAEQEKNIIRCLCIACNAPLVFGMDKEIDYIVRTTTGKKRFAAILKLSKTVSYCRRQGCGVPAHKIKIVKKKFESIIMLAEPAKKTDDDKGDAHKYVPQLLSAQFCYDKLRNVPDETYILFGFDPSRTRPEDMNILNFVVPPNQVRPSIRSDFASPSENDGLTNQLPDIIKFNESIRNSKGDGTLVKTTTSKDESIFLQHYVSSIIAGDASSAGNQKANKQNLAKRPKGKEGRMRGNLQGKRCNLTARSVVSPDPFIRLEDVGVPLRFALKLTYAEYVTPKNIAYLQTLVNNGVSKYPGAIYVERMLTDRHTGLTEPKLYSLAINTGLEITVGDKVMRHLQNGDVVGFNRQPSLHKGSFLGHTSQIIDDIKYCTLRMNVNVTEPYNADFDGDELNLHIPQSIQTVCELRLLAGATRHIINPTNSKVTIKPKQDTSMGVYVLTNDKTVVDWKDATNILMATSLGLTTKIPKNKMVSGKYLFSCILPPDLNVSRGNATSIVNGSLIKGQIGSADMAPIIQKIFFQYGSVKTRNFIDDMQKMMLLFLMKHGFTISIQDVVIDKEVGETVRKIIDTYMKKAMSDITRYENDPYSMTPEVFELSQQEILNGSLRQDITQVVMDNISHDNGLYLTIKSGSSGTESNIVQIQACIGQVLADNKRIPMSFGGRTLPCFARYDNSPRARGFCTNGFTEGATSPETFFSCIAGREGLINTNIKTADTGYLQRRSVKSMEDLSIKYDGTVRNAINKLIQVAYGGNGLNPTYQVEQHIGLIVSDNSAVSSKYVYTKQEVAQFKDSKYTEKINEQLFNKLLDMRNKMRYYQMLIARKSTELRDTFMLPVDGINLITQIVNNPKRTKGKIVDPYFVLQQIRNLYDGPQNQIIYHRKNSVIKKEDDHDLKSLFKFYLYDILSPKRCTHEYKLTEKEFMVIVNYINLKFYLSMAEPGEQVGTLAALAMGEPMSQTNLKSFQKAGLGNAVSGGLARVTEIINKSKKNKTPYMAIRLIKEYQNNKRVAEEIASNLRYIILADITKKATIVYDPNPTAKTSLSQSKGVTQVFTGSKSKSGCQAEYGNLSMVLEIILNKELMYENNISVLDIKASLCHGWENRKSDKTLVKNHRKILDKITQCAILSNFDNSDIPTIHIRFDGNYDNATLIGFQDMIVENFVIKGIKGITGKCSVISEKYLDFDKEGKMLTKERYMIYAEGINLEDIAQIRGIDLENTRSNNIVTVFDMYGIEAARALIISEFTEAFIASGVSINYQHVTVLADTITQKDKLTPINRHGTGEMDIDPLARASFEQATEQFVEAATYTQSDYMNNLSSRITIGAHFRGGTAACDLVFDHERMLSVLEKITPEQAPAFVQKKTDVSDLFNLVSA